MRGHGHPGGPGKDGFYLSGLGGQSIEPERIIPELQNLMEFALLSFVLA